MGFWQWAAKSFLDEKEYKRATAQQDAYNGGQVGVTGWLERHRANRQADQDANAWYEVNRFDNPAINDYNEGVRENRERVKDMIGGCWCNDPYCPNR